MSDWVCVGELGLVFFCCCLSVCFGARGKLPVFLSVFMRTYNSTYLYKKKSLVCVSESDTMGSCKLFICIKDETMLRI